MDVTFPNLSKEHDFFNYTSGRFLYNERIRLKERHLVFNVPELCNVVAKAFDKGIDEVSGFEKFAEGGSYRIFKATFKDGTEAIARLPFPCTLPKGYGILSEVATMAFLRKHGLPIPKVYDWSAKTANSVGSEYMIMEKVQGTDLQETWYSMAMEQRMDMVQKVVDLEKRLFDISLPACGSIYFNGTLPNGIHTVDIPDETDAVDVPDDQDDNSFDKFCIGPSTELLWWYSNRAELGADKGPWNHSAEVLKSVGQRELLWLQKYGQPRFPQNPAYRDLYQNQKVTPDIQIKVLQDYLKIAQFIVPDDEEMNRPTIRHQDLSPNNIFVDEGEVTGMIDWQHCIILPLFLQAKIPSHFQNYGDKESENFRPPQLPPDFDSLSDEEKEVEEDLYRRRQLHFFYLGATSHYNPRHYNALCVDPQAHRMRLFAKARSPWEGDNTSLKAQLISTVANWPKIRSTKLPELDCPISYSEQEVEVCLAMNAKQKYADRTVGALREFVGANIDGWVRNDEYPAMKESADGIKAQMIADAESDVDRKDIEDKWPFQDHEEID